MKYSSRFFWFILWEGMIKVLLWFMRWSTRVGSSIETFVQKLWGGIRGFREYFSSDHFGDAAAFWVILGFVKGSSLREPEETAYLLRHLAANQFSDIKISTKHETHWIFSINFPKNDKNPEKMNITSGPACIILSMASMLFKWYRHQIRFNAYLI
jgi:hypothetical protein